MRTDPATAPELPTACPSCGAAVRSQLSWCSLCFAALEPVAPATSAADDVAEVAEDDVVDDDVAQDRGAPVLAPAMVSTSSTSGPLTEAESTTLDAVASRLLAELAAQQRPLPGARLPGGRAARAGLLVAGGLGGCALLVGLLALLGLFL